MCDSVRELLSVHIKLIIHFIIYSRRPRGCLVDSTDIARKKMGNSSTKLAEKCLLLNKNEVPVVASSFKLASKNSEKIKEDELKKFWGTQMDPRLSQYVSNFLFGPLGNRNPVVDFQRFAELYVYCVRGTVDERIIVLMGSLGQTDSEQVEIAYPLIKEVS